MTDVAKLKIAIDTRDFDKAGIEIDKLEKSGNRASGALSKLPAVFTAIAGSMAVREAIRYADTMKLIEGRLSLVTSSSEELTRVQKELFAISQRSRVGFADTADLYSRMARSTEALGYTQNELLKVTETISKSFIISGASAESANAAIIQLGQGFASGTLRGEELNSVMEQSPRLAQAIAEGMGVTIGQLRQLGADGKLTAESVMEALRTQGDAISQEFGKMPMTVGQSMTLMSNSIMTFVGDMDEAVGATSELANAFEGISEFITDLSGQWKALFVAGKGIDEINTLNEINIKLVQKQRELAEELGKSTTFMWNSEKIERRNNIASIKEEIELLNKKAETIKNQEQEIAKIQEEKKANAPKAQAEDPSMPNFGMDYSAHITAYEDYLIQLESKKDRLLATLYPIEGIEQRFMEQQELITSLREMELISFEEQEALKTEVKRRYDNEQQKLEANKTKALKSMQQSVALEAVALLSTLAGKNKAAAVAGIAIQKGIAIATTIANTQAASMLAFSSQLIPGDPTSLARAAAAAASVESLGAVKVGLIAATGLLQAGQAMGGGGGGGIGGGGGNIGGYGSNQPMNDNLLAPPVQEETTTAKEVTINLGDTAFVSTEMVRELVNAINDEIGDGVVIRA